MKTTKFRKYFNSINITVIVLMLGAIGASFWMAELGESNLRVFVALPIMIIGQILQILVAQFTRLDDVKHWYPLQLSMLDFIMLIGFTVVVILASDSWQDYLSPLGGLMVIVAIVLEVLRLTLLIYFDFNRVIFTEDALHVRTSQSWEMVQLEPSLLIDKDDDGWVKLVNIGKSLKAEFRRKALAPTHLEEILAKVSAKGAI